MYKTVKVNSNGSGAGSAICENPRGFLRGVRIEYGGTPDANTVVTIAEANANSLQRTILTKTTGTDATYNPHDEIQNAAAAAQDQYTPFYFEGDVDLTVTVSAAVIDTTDAVVVRLLLSDG